MDLFLLIMSITPSSCNFITYETVKGGDFKITDDVHVAQCILWDLVDDILKLLSFLDNVIFL